MLVEPEGVEAIISSHCQFFFFWVEAITINSDRLIGFLMAISMIVDVKPLRSWGMGARADWMGHEYDTEFSSVV